MMLFAGSRVSAVAIDAAEPDCLRFEVRVVLSPVA
jgi:hypothetical protein